MPFRSSLFEPQYTTSEKGKNLIVFDGYTFHVNQKRKTHDLWTCSSSKRKDVKCKAQIKVYKDTGLGELYGYAHNHECPNKQMLYNIPSPKPNPSTLLQQNLITGETSNNDNLSHQNAIKQERDDSDFLAL